MRKIGNINYSRTNSGSSNELQPASVGGGGGGGGRGEGMREGEGSLNGTKKFNSGLQITTSEVNI